MNETPIVASKTLTSPSLISGRNATRSVTMPIRNAPATARSSEGMYGTRAITCSV